MYQGMSATDERLPEIINRMKHGATLTEESQRLGFPNNRALRDALFIKVGKEAFEKLVPESRNHDDFVMAYY